MIMFFEKEVPDDLVEYMLDATNANSEIVDQLLDYEIERKAEHEKPPPTLLESVDMTLKECARVLLEAVHELTNHEMRATARQLVQTLVCMALCWFIARTHSPKKCGILNLSILSGK